MSYTKDFGGTLNAIDQAAANAAFTPDATARKDFITPPPSDATQPRETVGGGDGSMVTATPSSSGTGAMNPGAGNRS